MEPTIAKHGAIDCGALSQQLRSKDCPYDAMKKLINSVTNMNFKTKFFSMFLVSLVFGIFLNASLIDNAQAYTYSGAARISCNDNSMTGCSLLCGGCGCYYTDNYIFGSGNISDKGACTVRKTVALPVPDECHPIAIFDSSCSSTESMCKEDMCPNDASLLDGAKCTVALGKSIKNPFGAGAVVDFSHTVIQGRWDASEKQCVECSGDKQARICATTTAISIVDSSRTCIVGMTAGATFEKGCQTLVSAACDDKSEGEACSPSDPVGGGFCDSTGQCVGAAVLTMIATTSDSTLAPSGIANITFTVKLNGSVIEGVAVTGISSTGGGSIASDCTNLTDANGTCTEQYTAPTPPIAPNPVTITASTASLAPNTSSSSASVNIAINGCGSLVDISCATNDDCLTDTLFNQCTGSSKWYTHNVCDTAAGICKPKFEASCSCNADCDACLACNPGDCVGPQWCDGSFAPAVLRDCDGSSGEPGCCPDAGPPSPPPPPPCTSNYVRTKTGPCSGVPGAMMINIEVDDTGSCNNPTTYEDYSCCVTNADCIGTDACDPSTGAYGTCVPCSGEGETATSAGLCCEGLDWMEEGGVMICSSKCDPKRSFFCNPLRKTVETLIQGSEKIMSYILGIIGSVALLLIIVSGTMYITSTGNDEKIASSKKILTGAVIGLGISLLAYSLLEAVISII